MRNVSDLHHFRKACSFMELQAVQESQRAAPVFEECNGVQVTEAGVELGRR